MLSNIFNSSLFQDSKYAYIPIDMNDEPTLISYAGRYKKVRK